MITAYKEAVVNLLVKTFLLLEWMPVCSEGSSGYKNRADVVEAMRLVAELYDVRNLV
jgi:hypothetical protein